ncbi:hypothetical protein [Burkholderia gladioli]|uniref:hypothetical protein n=1 Tax=Burkholderia gladioli TaxID=28095 RepID=UPI0016408492|nr:hypothetical protein [Burkholderia gladioli]
MCRDFDHSQCRFITGQRVRVKKDTGFLHPYFDLKDNLGTVSEVIPTPGGWVYNVILDVSRSNGLQETRVVQLMGDELAAAGWPYDRAGA